MKIYLLMEAMTQYEYRNVKAYFDKAAAEAEADGEYTVVEEIEIADPENAPQHH